MVKIELLKEGAAHIRINVCRSTLVSSWNGMKAKIFVSLVMTLLGSLLVSSCSFSAHDTSASTPAPATTNAPKAAYYTEYPATTAAPAGEVPKDAPKGEVPRDGDEHRIKIVRLYYATDRKRTGDTEPTKFYGSERTSRDTPLEYGVCHVTLPPEHQFAKLEEYSLLRWETKNSPEKHVTLVNLRPKAELDFFSDLRQTVNASSKKEIFVFIHGYNVTWEDSARRAGQIAYDIGLDKTRGAPLLFSWPSQGDLLGYVTDETNVRVSKLHLANLLTNLVAQSGAEHINILAHSMGNQALAEALHMIGLSMPTTQGPVFNQVIMAAPDIDVDQLGGMSEAMAHTAKHFTIYSCKSDLPVRVSRWFHGDHARVGSFALVNGFDTIDATLVQVSGLLNHSYVGSVPRVLLDVRKIFEFGCSVQERCCCCFEERREMTNGYWGFRAGEITNCSHSIACNR